MYYYDYSGHALVSLSPLSGFGPAVPPVTEGCLFAPVAGDPVLGRGSFKVNCPGQLSTPHGLEVLDASRLPQVEVDGACSAAIQEGRLTAVNMNRPGWEALLDLQPSPKKKRVNVLAIGDVGSTLLMGLKLLGGDVIDSIGICDLSDQITARWEFELGQIALPWNYDAMPEVEVIPPEKLFDGDLFVFVASKGIPPVGSQVQDVRMAQFQANAGIVKHYARMAREAHYQGLWCAVSDPVDPLAKTAYLESNKDENGVWDGKGLRPEQVQGYGLGVMNARAAYYAKRQPELFGDFLTEGRAFGPHGQDLVIANSIANYDDERSRALTKLAVTANMEMRALGYKPYVAPALSSGAISILLTLRGEWHYGAVYFGGIYMGCRTRYTAVGLETEVLDMPAALFERIRQAEAGLAALK